MVSRVLQVRVTLIDQSTHKAKVVGADPDKDVAVLQVRFFVAGARMKAGWRSAGVWAASDDRALYGACKS